MFKKLSKKKGFTLMEMMIVVAIIAVLMAIIIPTFTNAMNKAKAATDEANLRAYYAEVVAKKLLGEGSRLVLVRLTKSPWTALTISCMVLLPLKRVVLTASRLLIPVRMEAVLGPLPSLAVARSPD